MVEPGETKVRSKGAEVKKVSSSKRKIMGETTIQ